MKVSDLFLRCLENLGVDTIYGVPGEENADLMISLLDSKIKFITCRHEQNAAFMASQHGMITGKPGVCLATLGPGSTNLVTGVASANMDRAPLIAILGQADTKRLHKESHQNMDAVEMYRPITKWAVSVREPDGLPEVIDKAYKLAISSKPGATVIELPEDIAKMETNAKPLCSRNTDIEECPDPKQVAKAAELIEKAKKPLLLVGAGCVRESCDQEIMEFMKKTGIFGAVTFMGKGAIDARSELSLYCVGLGMKDIALEAFDQSDLIICAGYDLVEWPPNRWNEGCDKTIIHIDTLPAEVDSQYLPTVEMVGRIKLALRELNAKLTKNHSKEKDYFAPIRQRITAELDEHVSDDAFPMKPQRILSDIREVLAEDDVLISDIGAHKMWIARQYPTYQSGTCYISNGFCSMGVAMPTAFETKRLLPKRNVVAICGDGGFFMSIQALVTAVRYKIPITVIVWEDEYYGLIKWKQEAAYHKFSHVDLKNPDLVEVAKAFGCHTFRIEKADEFKSALTKALGHLDKPTVIVVPVDYSENMKLTKRLGEIVSH